MMSNPAAGDDAGSHDRSRLRNLLEQAGIDPGRAHEGPAGSCCLPLDAGCVLTIVPAGSRDDTGLPAAGWDWAMYTLEALAAAQPPFREGHAVPDAALLRAAASAMTTAEMLSAVRNTVSAAWLQDHGMGTRLVSGRLPGGLVFNVSPSFGSLPPDGTVPGEHDPLPFILDLEVTLPYSAPLDVSPDGELLDDDGHPEPDVHAPEHKTYDSLSATGILNVLRDLQETGSNSFPAPARQSRLTGPAAGRLATRNGAITRIAGERPRGPGRPLRR